MHMHTAAAEDDFQKMVGLLIHEMDVKPQDLSPNQINAYFEVDLYMKMIGLLIHEMYVKPQDLSPNQINAYFEVDLYMHAQ